MRKWFFVLIGAILLAKAKSEEGERDAEGCPEGAERCLWGDSYLKVKTYNGIVQGYAGKSCRTQKAFAGFRGIPYAVPPVGKLRFRDPVPVGNWVGIWNGTYQRSSCIQGVFGIDAPSVNTDGYSEDCLYLNVYTPNVNYLKFGLAPLKAVMLFIHPGGFTSGSSREGVYSPDFLIDQDVVVVTFNYRLGALGFLSLQNSVVPGNAGLKDQNLVLKWVKKNIKSFGGDPNKITIFGQSAGSASVNYHILSKASEGLFRSAIMQSGTAITPWGFTTPKYAVKKARSLGNKVKCPQKNLDELLNCLQKVPAELIIKNQQGTLTLEELFTLRIIAFEPTIEPDVPGAFLTESPLDLLYGGNFTKVPSIIGSTTDEALLIYSAILEADPTGFLISLVGMDLSRFVPYVLRVRPFTRTAAKVHQQISRFYFNSKAVTKAELNNILELLTDTMFTLPIQLTSALFANASVPVYNYLFSYDGGYNVFKAATNITDVPGSSHGDDLGYLFYVPRLHALCGRSSPERAEDELLIDRMTKMWADFAKTGNPTPASNSKIPVTWKPFTNTNRFYLNIGKDLLPSSSLKKANMMFWDNLIRDLLDDRLRAVDTEDLYESQYLD